MSNQELWEQYKEECIRWRKIADRLTTAARKMLDDADEANNKAMEYASKMREVLEAEEDTSDFE
mgnify:CR=1 FL=1